MKLLISLVFITFLSVPDGRAQTDQQQLTYIKKVLWPKAYREQDTKLLDKILADEFQMIDSQGNWTTKKDEIQYITEHKASYDSLSYKIRRLEILDGHTAVVSGVGTVISTSENDGTVTTTYHSSNILIKRNGEWKAISSHVSGVKQTN